MLNLNVACCLCVRNCESFLPKIFDNLDILSREFKEFHVIFSYDNCSDNTENLLIEYKNSKNYNIILIKNLENNNYWRCIRIADARNQCLNIIFNKIKNIDFHFMIDADEVNIEKWNIEIIKKYLNSSKDWDSVSFNRKNYYDIYALLFDEYKHHCYGFIMEDNLQNAGAYVADIMKKELLSKLNNELNNNNLFECYSAFNGFAIYKTDKFKNIYYDALHSNFKLLFTEEERQSTLKYINSKLNTNFKIHPNNYECCEHLFYHISAIKQNNAKIRISKECLY